MQTDGLKGSRRVTKSSIIHQHPFKIRTLIALLVWTNIFKRSKYIPNDEQSQKNHKLLVKKVKTFEFRTIFKTLNFTIKRSKHSNLEQSLKLEKLSLNSLSSMRETTLICAPTCFHSLKLVFAPHILTRVPHRMLISVLQISRSFCQDFPCVDHNMKLLFSCA